MVVLVFFSANFLSAQNFEIPAIRIWDSESQNFGPPVALVVRSGKVVQIRTLPQDSHSAVAPQVPYALPGFCDPYTTLGVNAWGGSASPDSVKISLQVLLAHGFTHVESVGDGKWLDRVRGYLDRGQWKGPILSQASPPVLPATDDAPPGLFRMYTNEETLVAAVAERKTGRAHIYHRDSGKYFPDTREFYALRNRISPNASWVVHTFGDRRSSADALALTAHWKAIFHPIDANPPQEQWRDLRYWSPLIGIYANQTIRSQESWEKARTIRLENPVFRLYYGEVGATLADSWILPPESEPESDENAVEGVRAKKPEANPEPSASQKPKPRKPTQQETEYQNYLSQFRNRSGLKDRLLFATGTGHPLVFPGDGAIREMEIWDGIFQAWWSEETAKRLLAQTVSESALTSATTGTNLSWWKKTREWIFGLDPVRTIQSPVPEASKIPPHRFSMLDVYLRNSCEFLQAGHGGEIRVGKEANLLVYDHHPLETIAGLFRPRSVAIRGKVVVGKIQNK